MEEAAAWRLPMKARSATERPSSRSTPSSSPMRTSTDMLSRDGGAGVGAIGAGFWGVIEEGREGGVGIGVKSHGAYMGGLGLGVH